MKLRTVGVLLAVAIGAGVLTLYVRSRAPDAPVQSGAAERELVFAVVGDTEGHTDILDRILKTSKERGASFVLHTGDVTEDGSEQGFAEIRNVIGATGLPVHAAIGNHDSRTDGTPDLFRKYLNEPNQAFDAGGLRFVIIDNADRSVGFSPETLAWLARDLAEHRSARYVIVFHRPFMFPLSQVVGDDETPTSRRTNDEFLRLIETARVAAIFAGHLHTYLPYSLAGIPTYVTGGGGGEPQTALGAFGKKQKHFLLVHASGQQLRIEVVPLE